MSENRYTRFSTLLPVNDLRMAGVMIVGVGAIGRQVALQLASMGVMELDLIDPDEIDVTNCGTQGFSSEEIGLSKIQSVENDCLYRNEGMRINSCESPFDQTFPSRSTLQSKTALFCCVDSMAARRIIYHRAFECGIPFVVDGRMAAEVIRVVAAANAQSTPMTDTLIPDDQAHPEPCTAKATIYTASIAAGLMINAWTQYLRTSGEAKDRFFVDYLLSLPAWELFPTSTEDAGVAT